MLVVEAGAGSRRSRERCGVFRVLWVAAGLGRGSSGRGGGLVRGVATGRVQGLVEEGRLAAGGIPLGLEEGLEYGGAAGRAPGTGCASPHSEEPPVTSLRRATPFGHVALPASDSEASLSTTRRPAGALREAGPADRAIFSNRTYIPLCDRSEIWYLEWAESQTPPRGSGEGGGHHGISPGRAHHRTGAGAPRPDGDPMLVVEAGAGSRRSRGGCGVFRVLPGGGASFGKISAVCRTRLRGGRRPAGPAPLHQFAGAGGAAEAAGGLIEESNAPPAGSAASPTAGSGLSAAPDGPTGPTARPPLPPEIRKG